MKIFKCWKKTAAIIAAGFILVNGCAVPVMAHGHHGGGCGGHNTYSKGTYCAYHDKVHKKASNCKYYCTKHHVTHSNGKCHH